MKVKIEKTPRSNADAEEILREICEINTKLKKAHAKIEKKQAKLSDEIATIRAEADWEKLSAEKAELYNRLEKFARANKNVLFTDAKTVKLPHGQFGFRLSPEALSKPKQKTWAEIALELLEIDQALVSSELSVNRALAKKPEYREKIAQAGLKVIQKETFFAKTAVEETP